MLRIGSKVKLKPGLYREHPMNPTNLMGTVVEYNLNSNWVYRVQWENGNQNGYKEGEIFLARPRFADFIRKVEESYEV